MSQYQAGAQFNFTAGELAPKLHDRPDLGGARELMNMVAERHGGIKRREGSQHISVIDDARPGRLIPFRRSSATNYQIEITANRFRFYTQAGNLVTRSNGVVAEVATPWNETELDALRFDQTGDVMYITHPSYKPRKLSQVEIGVFELVEIDQKGGPFLSERFDEAHRIQASARTGTFTLSATQDTWRSGHVGSLWKLRWEDRSQHRKWMSGDIEFIEGALVISRGKAYRCTEGGEVGGNAPDHTEGIEQDGNEPLGRSCSWQWLHSGYGVVEITAYISPRQVTARLVIGEELPEDIVRVGTKYWSEAAWSDDLGWPQSVGFYNDRLAFARANEVVLSQNADFENFEPTDEHGDIVTTAGLRIVLSDDQANSIQWLRQTGEVLMIGTTGSEWTLGPQAQNEPFGPDNVLAAPQSYHGAADFVQPIRIGDALLFVGRSGRRMYEMTISDISTRYNAVEISILSDHLMKNGVVEMAYAESPEGVLWCLTKTGTVVALTYERSQDVTAWHQHELAGEDAFVESVSVITSEDETYDEVWMIVARTVNGQTVRHVERLAAPWEDQESIDDAVFLDASVTFRGVPKNTARVGHLPNTDIVALADGRIVEGLRTNGAGDVELPFAAATCTFGLPYRSRLKTMRPDLPARIGQSLGKLMSIPTIWVKFDRTNLCNYARVKLSDSNPDLYVLPFLIGSDAASEAVPLFTGVKQIDLGSDYDEDYSLWFEQTQPVPMTIRAIAYDVVTANR